MNGLRALAPRGDRRGSAASGDAPGNVVLHGFRTAFDHQSAGSAQRSQQDEAGRTMDAAFNGFQPIDPSLDRPVAQGRREVNSDKAKSGARA